MHAVEESVVISRSREEVWAYVVDPANFTSWVRTAIEYEADHGGDPKLGDHDRLVGKIAGRRIEVTREVTEVVPGKKLAVKTVRAPFPSSSVFRFEDAESGTLVTFRGETSGLGGFFGKLGDPVVVKVFARDVRTNLATLKAILEGSDGSRGPRLSG
jgi:uncharacterized protein YndB with AHSA1/START domain